VPTLPTSSNDNQAATDNLSASSQSGAGEETAAEIRTAYKALVERANRGDRDALDQLRKVLDRVPSIWQRVGDLNAKAEWAWVQAIAGPNRLAAESTTRFVQEMKQELAGPRPTPIENLLVDQIAVAWLASRDADIRAATQDSHSLTLALFHLKRAEVAQRRFLAAVKTLAMVRSLLAAGLAPARRPACPGGEQEPA
jgi:hypothetical protein